MFFIVVTSILSFVLLLANFVFAPHNPYREKKTPFECGYHSFLAQSRTQFTISFFIFGLLFLLFDLEIVMIYPLTVSGYINEGYGFIVIILFVLILALGFIFELGKKALKIDSKQISNLLLSASFKSHNFVNSSLQSNIFSFIVMKMLKFAIKKIKLYILASTLTWLKSHIFCATSTYVKKVFKDTSANFIQLIFYWGIINTLNFIATFMYLIMYDLRKNIVGGIVLLFVLSFSIENSVFLTNFLIKICLLGLLLYIHTNCVIPYYYRNVPNIWLNMFVIISFSFIICCVVLVYWDIFYMFECIINQMLDLVYGLILKATGGNESDSNFPGSSKQNPKGPGGPDPDPDPDNPISYGHNKQKRKRSKESEEKETEKKTPVTYYQRANPSPVTADNMTIEELTEERNKDPLRGMDIENMNKMQLISLRDKMTAQAQKYRGRLNKSRWAEHHKTLTELQLEYCIRKRDRLSYEVKRSTGQEEW